MRGRPINSASLHSGGTFMMFRRTIIYTILTVVFLLKNPLPVYCTTENNITGMGELTYSQSGRSEGSFSDINLLEGMNPYATTYFLKIEKLINNKEMSDYNDIYNHILSKKQPDGTFLFDSSSTHNKLYDTYLALEMLKDLGKLPKNNDKIIAYINNLKCENGLYSSTTNNKPSLYSTSLVLNICDILRYPVKQETAYAIYSLLLDDTNFNQENLLKKGIYIYYLLDLSGIIPESIPSSVITKRVSQLKEIQNKINSDWHANAQNISQIRNIIIASKYLQTPLLLDKNYIFNGISQFILHDGGLPLYPNHYKIEPQVTFHALEICKDLAIEYTPKETLLGTLKLHRIKNGYRLPSFSKADPQQMFYVLDIFKTTDTKTIYKKTEIKNQIERWFVDIDDKRITYMRDIYYILLCSNLCDILVPEKTLKNIQELYKSNLSNNSKLSFESLYWSVKVFSLINNKEITLLDSTYKEKLYNFLNLHPISQCDIDELYRISWIGYILDQNNFKKEFKSSILKKLANHKRNNETYAPLESIVNGDIVSTYKAQEILELFDASDKHNNEHLIEYLHDCKYPYKGVLFYSYTPSRELVDLVSTWASYKMLNK